MHLEVIKCTQYKIIIVWRKNRGYCAYVVWDTIQRFFAFSGSLICINQYSKWWQAVIAREKKLHQILKNGRRVPWVGVLSPRLQSVIIHVQSEAVFDLHQTDQRPVIDYQGLFQDQSWTSDWSVLIEFRHIQDQSRTLNRQSLTIHWYFVAHIGSYACPWLS